MIRRIAPRPALGKRRLLVQAARFCGKRALPWILLASTSPCLAGGRIEVVGPREIDLGKFRAWKKRTARYTVRNAGRDPLIIKSVKAACACAETSCTSTNLKTGQGTEIKVTIIPNSIYGAFRKPVYVESSDPERRFTDLFIAGHAVPIVTVLPKRYLHAGHIETNTAWSKSFTLTPNTAGLSFGKPRVECGRPVNVKLARAQDNAPGYRLDVDLPPTRDSGDFACLVRLPVTAPAGHPDVEVAIQARIGTSLMAFPAVLPLPVSDKPLVRTFRLRLPRHASARLDPARLSVPRIDGITLDISREKGAHGLVVRAEFAPAFLRALASMERVRLNFSLPRAASAEVTISPDRKAVLPPDTPAPAKR